MPVVAALAVAVAALAGTAMTAMPAEAAVATTVHPIPGAGLNSGGVTSLCYNATGFSCAGDGYNGTSSQIGGNGWTIGDYWSFGSAGPNGTKHNCTTYAAYRLQENGYPYPNWTDDATGWAADAAKHGVTVNQTPAVGAIAQWNKGTGHVAYVEAVTSTYIETTSDSYDGGTDHLRISLSSAYMPDNFIHFKDVPQTAPAQPADPRVTSTTGTSAVLTWTEASSNVASFVSQYKIGSGAWVAGPPAGANVTTMTVPGLKIGTRYTFQVGARNSIGTHWSAYFYGTTVSLPAEPTNSRVTSTTATSAVLAWTDASNNETSFASQYKIGSGAWVAGPSVGAGGTTMTITGLSPSTTYTFQVGARNSAGTHWSGYSTGKTAAQPSQPPAPAPPAAGYHTGREVTIDKHATGGVSGHAGPGNSYAAGPTHAVNSAITIVCYVTGQSITGPYDTTNIWDLSGSYYYSDAWLYTGTNGPAVPAC